MSKKFYAVNRETGERWKPEEGTKQYLMMYDSGYLAVVEEDFYIYMKPLDTKVWRKVLRGGEALEDFKGIKDRSHLISFKDELSNSGKED